MENKRGMRLGHRFVKIWKCVTARSKKRRYLRLRSKTCRRIRGHGFNLWNRLRRGSCSIQSHRQPDTSQALASPNSCNSKGSSPLFSSPGGFGPECGMESVLLHSQKPKALYSEGQCFHFPHFRVQSLHFPHIARHWHLPAHSGHNHGKKMEMRELFPSLNPKTVPKGFLAVYVGQGEEHHRFVIPVIDFNHPLFAKLLEDAEEQYGFDQKGIITLPCQIDDFEHIQKLIHTEHPRKH